jgi:hypothetical protein
LFEGGFEVIADFLGENVRVREVLDSSRLSPLSQGCPE